MLNFETKVFQTKKYVPLKLYMGPEIVPTYSCQDAKYMTEMAISILRYVRETIQISFILTDYLYLRYFMLDSKLLKAL